MSSISFLLDENITPKAVDYLIEKGFQCQHIVSMGYQGADDETVLKLARDTGSSLCTMNGKDFVIQVIPEGYKNHYGLFWVIDNVTRKNYTNVFDVIISYLKTTDSIENKILKLREVDNGFIITQKYPENNEIMSWTKLIHH